MDELRGYIATAADNLREKQKVWMHVCSLPSHRHSELLKNARGIVWVAETFEQPIFLNVLRDRNLKDLTLGNV